MISKSCKYGIRAAVFIASKATGNRKLGVKEIAEEIEAPPAFTGKILQILNKQKIVTSLKGPYGGFYSQPYQLDIPVIDIVKAVDGLGVFEECIMGLHECNDAHPCPMHHNYAKSRDALKITFQQTTVRSLAKSISEGVTHIRNMGEM